MTVRYHGAYSGLYTYEVVGIYCTGTDNNWETCAKARRNFATIVQGSDPAEDWTLCVRVQVLDYFPRGGSLYGGTLVTLYGWEFVDDPDRIGENIVKMGQYRTEIVNGVESRRLGTRN